MNKSKKKETSDLLKFLITILLLIILFLPSGSMAMDSTEKSDIGKIIKDNKNILFSENSRLEINEIEKNDGIIVVNLTIDGNKVPFYLTNGKKLILQVVPVEKITKGKNKVLEGAEIKKGQVVINDKLKEAVKNFINNYLIQGGGKDIKVEIGKISKEDGLIKVNTTLQGEDKPIYLTPSGSKIAFQVISLDDYKKEIIAQREAQKKAAKVSAENKNDKPTVDLFVMSYCPYGTQIEKGILPVLNLLKDKIDSKIRFVDYAMHGQKEIDENLLQYCIQKEEPNKINNYLKCFLENGDSKKCLKENGLSEDVKKNNNYDKQTFFSKITTWFKKIFTGNKNDKMAKIKHCIEQTDKRFKVSENFKDKSTWKGQFPTFDIDKADNAKYGVQGSPTLIINGQKIQPAGRDAKHLLESVCSGFKNPPAECQKELSSKTPSAGFGSGATSGGSGGGCAQ